MMHQNVDNRRVLPENENRVNPRAITREQIIDLIIDLHVLTTAQLVEKYFAVASTPHRSARGVINRNE